MSNVRADDCGTALLGIVRELIRRDGPMPVDRYMRLCLAHPQHGYWQRAGTIGAGGDFITAPEIGQVFGELIGLWCAVVWQGMGRAAPLRLVELGPGRGTLMGDALRAARAVPGFLDAIDVHLIEVSHPLQELQRQMLASSPRRRGSTQLSTHDRPDVAHASLRGHDATWHETLDQVPEGPAIIIANEFLDALPIRQLVFVDGVWRERVIAADAQRHLRFEAGPEAAELEDVCAALPPEPGAIHEMRAGEQEVLGQLAARQAPLVALFIDYGPAEATYGDTLQAVRRHAYVDPLRQPGRADLTAHVRFAPLARRARKAGLAADGPLSQAEFLGRLGAAERAARLMAANPASAGTIEAGVQRLMSPTGMGELFKVLAVRSRSLPPPPPFL